MYRCNRDADHHEFTVEAVRPVRLVLDEDGRETAAGEGPAASYGDTYLVEPSPAPILDAGAPGRPVAGGPSPVERELMARHGWRGVAGDGEERIYSPAYLADAGNLNALTPHDE